MKSLSNLYAVPPLTLTDAATITVNAASGTHFRVTLGGNRTMGAPSNPIDGQRVLFEVIQDGTGGRTLAWASGAGGYTFSSGLPAPTITTGIAKRDFVLFVYNSTANTWYCLGYTQGF